MSAVLASNEQLRIRSCNEWTGTLRDSSNLSATPRHEENPRTLRRWLVLSTSWRQRPTGSMVVFTIGSVLNHHGASGQTEHWLGRIVLGRHVTPELRIKELSSGYVAPNSRQQRGWYVVSAGVRLKRNALTFTETQDLLNHVRNARGYSPVAVLLVPRAIENNSGQTNLRKLLSTRPV